MPGNKQQSRCSKMRENQQQGASLARVQEQQSRAVRAASGAGERNRYRARLQGLTSRTECATLRSIEHTKERYSTKHESRTRRTRRARAREGSQGNPHSREGTAQAARTRAKPRASTRGPREGAQPRGHPRGEAGSASGRRVSRMSAPNLGAHRTPTRPSRQHATYSGFT